MSYFDISSAEVRAAAAQSKDEHLNELFNTRQDVYNFAAKLYVGEDKYEQLSKADKKKLRKNFKTVMLGVLYGLGKCNAVQYRNILENQWAKSMKAEKYRNIRANVELTCEIKRP